MTEIGRIGESAWWVDYSYSNRRPPPPVGSRDHGAVMDGPTQSRQEAFMKTFCGRTMAAPFVFVPKKWQIGSGRTREPADIIWVCNNTVMLIYMTQIKLYNDSDKNIRNFDKGVNHNLKQANRALQLWKRHPLCGQNQWYGLSLSYRPDIRIVVLSLVGVGDSVFSAATDHAYLEIHEDWAKEHGVVLCATIPHTTIQTLAGCGGSVLDLLHLLCNVFRHKTSEIQSVDIIKKYILSEFHDSDHINLAEHGVPASDARFVAAVVAMCNSLAKTRHRPMAHRANPPKAINENFGAQYGMLSDITLGETMAIARTIATCIMLANLTSDLAIISLPLDYYDCEACATHKATNKTDRMNLYKSWEEQRKGKPKRGGLFFIYDLERCRMHFWLSARVNPSHTEELLDDFKKNRQ